MLQVREIEWHFFHYWLEAIYFHKGGRALWFRYTEKCMRLEEAPEEAGCWDRHQRMQRRIHCIGWSWAKRSRMTLDLLIWSPFQSVCAARERGSEHWNRPTQIPLSQPKRGQCCSVFLGVPGFSSIVCCKFHIQPTIRVPWWVRRTVLTLKIEDRFNSRMLRNIPWEFLKILGDQVIRGEYNSYNHVDGRSDQNETWEIMIIGLNLFSLMLKPETWDLSLSSPDFSTKRYSGPLHLDVPHNLKLSRPATKLVIFPLPSSPPPGFFISVKWYYFLPVA